MREGGNVKEKGCKALGIYVLLHAHNIYISINIATTYALLHTHNTSEGTHQQPMPHLSILMRIQLQWMKRVIVLEDNIMTPIYFVSLISNNDVFLETL